MSSIFPPFFSLKLESKLGLRELLDSSYGGCSIVVAVAFFLSPKRKSLIRKLQQTWKRYCGEMKKWK
jgi:hypothetical protein